jgi:transposase
MERKQFFFASLMAYGPNSVLNAIFYLLRSGCQWRLLPREFPPWSTVYYYFRSWDVLITAAINLVRLAAWFAGNIPSLTRTPPLVTVLESGST